MWRIVTLSVCSILMTACASTDTTSEVSKESIQYVDLSAPDKQELVKKFWSVKKRKEPKYPIHAAQKRISGCVNLIVGINSDGRLGGYTIENSYPEGVFDKSAAFSLSKWKWVATEENIEKFPVLTTVQLDFMVKGAKNKDEAEKQCGSPHKL